MSVRSVPAGPAFGQVIGVPGRSPSVTGLGAVLLIVAVSLVGACLDLLTGTGLRLAFGITLTLGAAVAALVVRRASLLVVVLAPPLVYVVASAAALLAAPGGAGSLGALYDAGAGWLIYGFPTIAAATGVAGVVAGIRLAGSRT
jgi:hypothetical protein